MPAARTRASVSAIPKRMTSWPFISSERARAVIGFRCPVAGKQNAPNLAMALFKDRRYQLSYVSASSPPGMAHNPLGIGLANRAGVHPQVRDARRATPAVLRQ